MNMSPLPHKLVVDQNPKKVRASYHADALFCWATLRSVLRRSFSLCRYELDRFAAAAGRDLVGVFEHKP